MTQELTLLGCTAEPLLNYLKALGVLRLVAEQADRDARAAWRQDRLVLRSRLDRATLLAFFAYEYRPTPIIGPWAGGSGFFPGDNVKALTAISTSTSPRVAALRRAIAAAQKVLAELGVTTKPSGDRETKVRLLRALRARLDDAALLWLDAAWALSDEGQAAAPLLGTGGNDGRFDFSRNFLERLVDLGVHDTVDERQVDLLEASLFDTPIDALKSYAVGQFDPGAAGGPNATVGMEGTSVLNPWDWVLGLEGAVLFAGAASRRYRARGGGRAAFPFTVEATTVGGSAAVSAETGDARGEVWLPLWPRWVGLAEVRHLLTEGRLTVGRRQAADGVESARAVASLGVQRGLNDFVRVGLLKRFGKNYLALPMGRFAVRRDPCIGLLQSGGTDRWLQRYRQRARSAPPRFQRAVRHIDAAVVDVARRDGPRPVAALLCALGEAERELAAGSPPGMVLKPDQIPLRPCPVLPADWLPLADDGSVEYRLASALASLGAHGQAPLREDLEPVRIDQASVRWQTQGTAFPERVYSSPALLTTLLERRLLQHGLDGLGGSRSAELTDVALYVTGQVDDRRLLSLVWGLACVAPWARHRPRTAPASGRQASVIVPREWAAMALLFDPAAEHAMGASADDLRGDTPGQAGAPGAGACRTVLALLRAGSVEAALRETTRRLRASGRPIAPGRTPNGRERLLRPLAPPRPERLAAALLFPLSRADRHRLFALLCISPDRDDLETGLRPTPTSSTVAMEVAQ